MNQPDQHKGPLVSIAMAAYNGAKYISLQLDTLVAQTYNNFELIISDDGSSDQTLQIIESYIKKYPFISLYNNQGAHGIKKNFENAIQSCRGEYIALCDQDDIWLPQKIEKLVNGIGSYALIYHNSLFIDSEGLSLDKTITDNRPGYTGADPKAFLLLNGVSGHACMFKRKLIAMALPFPQARYHDWWLAFIAAQNGGVKYLDEVLVQYRQHPQSKTDILGRKNETIHQKEFSIFDEELEWYNSCAVIPGAEQAFFRKWAKLYEVRKNQWLSFSLFRLARKNAGILYIFKKKNRLSKFFESLKLLWGIKTKKAANH